MKLLILILAVVPLTGDTLLTGSQIRPCVGVCVLMTDRGMSGWVEIDPTSLQVVEVGGRRVLQASGAGTPSLAWIQRVEEVTAARADWVLLDAVVAGSLDVSRNGLVMSPGVDFMLTGLTVSFLGAQVPQAGDVLRFKYQR